MQENELWIELPPPNDQVAKRLILFVHSGQTSTEAFLPVAIHWQLKFPSALAIVMHTPIDKEQGQGWLSDPGLSNETELQAAITLLAQRIKAAQSSSGLGSEKTILIGHGVGASLLLELARRGGNGLTNDQSTEARSESPAAVWVAFSARLSSLSEGSFPTANYHLIHGELDTIVPVQHGRRAHRAIVGDHAPSTLDILDHSTFWIDQDMINIATQRVMQSLFQDRRKSKLINIH